jgi:hypothetical protein
MSGCESTILYNETMSELALNSEGGWIEKPMELIGNGIKWTMHTILSIAGTVLGELKGALLGK